MLLPLVNEASHLGFADAGFAGKENRCLRFDADRCQLETEADEAYTSHNTKLLNVEETVEKLLTTDYVREQVKAVEK